MKIYKYPLANEDEQFVQMQPNPHILCVQEQNGVITVWAEVDELIPPTSRKFYIYGTGLRIDTKGKTYIGTVQRNGFVWHIFTETK
jgi:hypothetical protein